MRKNFLLKKNFKIREIKFDNFRHIYNSEKLNFISPCCIKIKGYYYLFYAISSKTKKKSNTQIYFSKSKDLIRWDKPSLLIDNTTCHGSHRVLSPSVCEYKNKYYIFFEAVNNKTSCIMYASSPDLEEWHVNKTPILKDYRNQINFRSPCIYTLDNKIFIFHSRKSKKSESVYYSQFDCKNFPHPIIKKKIFAQSKKKENYSIYSPTIYKHGYSEYMMYAAWSYDPIKTSFLLAKKEDINNWRKLKYELSLPKTSLDIVRYSEPSVLMVNNQIKLFFEGCDRYNNWKLYIAD